MTTEVLTFAARVAGFVALTGAILWPLEHLTSRSTPRLTWRSWAVDLGWLVLGALTLRLLVGPVLSVFLSSHRESGPLRLILAFLGAEVMAYVTHRAMHEVPWLRRFHAVHHTHEPLDWLKAWRQHPVDVAIHALAVAIPALCLGVSWTQFGAVVLLRRIWTGFLHANTRVRLGWLEGLVATPAFHHHHHRHPRSNYAGLLPVVDRLFGTFKAAS